MWWSESDGKSEPLQEARAYFEATAGVVDAIHSNAAPFDGLRWRYLQEDLESLRRYVARNVTGHVIDIGCGAGHWSDYYGEGATDIDFVDFSPKLLAQAAARAERRWGHVSVAVWPTDICASGNAVPFAKADWILLAFVVSHYDVDRVVQLLAHLRTAAKPGAGLVVIDSWHSPARQRKRPQETVRNVDIDGRRVSILKRYFGRKEWGDLVDNAGLEMDESQWGRAFFLSRLRASQRSIVASGAL